MAPPPVNTSVQGQVQPPGVSQPDMGVIMAWFVDAKTLMQDRRQMQDQIKMQVQKPKIPVKAAPKQTGRQTGKHFVSKYALNRNLVKPPASKSATATQGAPPPDPTAVTSSLPAQIMSTTSCNPNIASGAPSLCNQPISVGNTSNNQNNVVQFQHGLVSQTQVNPLQNVQNVAGVNLQQIGQSQVNGTNVFM